MNKVYNSINKLNLDENIIEKLESNNIVSLEELWILKRLDLKRLGFNNDEINEIITKLQLMGLDLNKKKY